MPSTTGIMQYRVVTGSDDGCCQVFSCTPDLGWKHESSLVPDQPAGADAVCGITSVSFGPSDGDSQVLTSCKDGDAKIWKEGVKEHQKDRSLTWTRPVLHQCMPALEPPQPTTGWHRHHHHHHPPQPVAEGHSDCANMASFCPNKADLVVTCSDDKTAIIWDAVNGTPVHKLQNKTLGHTGPVTTAQWDLEGSKILTSSWDKTCLLWNARHGGCVMQFPGSKAYAQDAHTGAIWSAQFSQDCESVMTASSDGTAKIWDAKEGRCKLTLAEHEDAVLGAVWCPGESSQVLTCSMDNTARFWDIREGTRREICKIDRHTGAVWQASFSHDPSNFILTVSHDMTAYVWDRKMTQKKLVVPRYPLIGHTGILWNGTFSPDDKWLVTCSEDRTARVWELTSKRPPCFILGEGDKAARNRLPVTCAAFEYRNSTA